MQAKVPEKRKEAPELITFHRKKRSRWKPSPASINDYGTVQSIPRTVPHATDERTLPLLQAEGGREHCRPGVQSSQAHFFLTQRLPIPPHYGPAAGYNPCTADLQRSETA